MSLDEAFAQEHPELKALRARAERGDRALWELMLECEYASVGKRAYWIEGSRNCIAFFREIGFWSERDGWTQAAHDFAAKMKWGSGE